MIVHRRPALPAAARQGRPLSTRGRLRLAVGRRLDKWLTPLGVWLYRRTKGGITRPWKVDALLLTTHGRRSDRERTVVLQFFPDGESMVLAAANDGGSAHPGWYFNLTANPAARVEVMGRAIAVRAEELPADEAAAWWQRIVQRAPTYEQYTRATSRTFPIMRLVPVTAPDAPLPYGPLPYGPLMTRMLPEIQRGFQFVNRYVAVPLIRAGLGPLLHTPVTGSMMVLRTRGRTSGLWREAPLGYLILDGHVYCCAGFGHRTQWLRNIEADPHVEVLLPTLAVTGVAEEVTDPQEWSRGMRALLASLGVISRVTIGDVRRASDEGLRAMAGGLPLIRIRVTGLGSGPFDPGGRGWTVPTLLSVAWLATWALRRLRRPRRS